MARVRIATRESELALWQARFVAEKLTQNHPGLIVELVPMTTRGDRILDQPLAEIGGKGLFLKELEHALLDARADIAVHSLKDVPAELPGGLEIAVAMARHDPRDALVSQRFGCLQELPKSARLGTSSLRRQAQLMHLRPDLTIIPLRGNVNTRLLRLDEGRFDAIVLAAAGLQRLAMDDRITEIIEPSVCLPAVAQGAIGIECRVGDRQVRALIDPLNDPVTACRVQAERAFGARLEGGCQVPIAAYAEHEDGQLQVTGLVARIDGSEVLRAQISGPGAEAQALGTSLAESLIAQGADRILAAL